LKNHNIETDAEKIYFVEILSLLLNLSDSLEDCFKVIDKEELRNLFREDYKSKRKKYMSMAETILKENYVEIGKQERSIKNLNNSLEEFKMVLTKETNLNKITNDKASILGALGHMHCNRLTGNRDIEFRNLVILRHTIHDILQKYRYLNN
jgi:hypothetical protein